VIHGTLKWIGPTWAQIDDRMIFRTVPSKTERTSDARFEVDLSACPMVLEEIARIPAERRVGPLVVNPQTGLPFRDWAYRNLWRRVAIKADIPKTVWNRDLRAGGITEARKAGARTEDMAKTAGHTNVRTTARVYDRDTLEAARRVAKARVAHRHRDKPGT
jgi:integrase